MSNNQEPEPEVGMGATLLFGMTSNEHRPATIAEVVLFKSGARRGEISKIGVRADHYWLTEDGSTPGWASEEDPEAPVVWYRKDQRGKWRTPHGSKVGIGYRSYAYDIHL